MIVTCSLNQIRADVDVSLDDVKDLHKSRAEVMQAMEKSGYNPAFEKLPEKNQIDYTLKFIKGEN